MKTISLMTLFFSSLLTTPLLAIVIRHDLNDMLYHANPNDYPYIISVGGGTGVVIAPHWILTAAHVAKYVARGEEISTAGVNNSVEEIFIHPHSNLLAPHIWEHDIALIRSEQPIIIPNYPKLYRETDEESLTAIFLGRGGTGNGIDGETGEDGILRNATNAIDAIEGAWLRFDFDKPEMSSALEGVSGTGDSGGPALVFKNRQTYVAGISSFQNTGEHANGQYGVTEYYARIYAYMSWIDLVVSAKASERSKYAYKITNCTRVAISEQQLQKYTGSYEFESGIQLRIIAEGDVLFRTKPLRRLRYCGGDHFTYEKFDIDLEFSRNPDGYIDGVVFKQWYQSHGQKINVASYQ